MAAIQGANPAILAGIVTNGTHGASKATAQDGAGSPFAQVLAKQRTESDAGDGASGATSRSAGTPRDDEYTMAQDRSLASLIPTFLAGIGQQPPQQVANVGQPDDSGKPGRRDAANPVDADADQAVVIAPTIAVATSAPADQMRTSETDALTARETALPTAATPPAVTNPGLDSGSPSGQQRPADGQQVFVPLSGAAAEPAGRPGRETADSAKPAAIVAAAPENLTSDPDRTLVSGVQPAAVAPDKARVADGISAADARAMEHTLRDEPAASATPTPGLVQVPVAHGEPQAGPAAEYHVAASVGSHHWSDSIANSLVVMTNGRQERADLVLTPPQLGRIEVSVSVSAGQANAIFVSANPDVRQALENALPRLREVLADAGITLGQAQVGSESLGQSANHGNNNDNSRSGSMPGFGTIEVATTSVNRESQAHLVISRGLVDTFV